MAKYQRTDYGDHILDDIIPDDEPVFLIRGQDAVGGAAVRCWADLAACAGADPKMVAMAREHAKAMDAWPKKGVPDLPAGID